MSWRQARRLSPGAHPRPAPWPSRKPRFLEAATGTTRRESKAVCEHASRPPRDSAGSAGSRCTLARIAARSAGKVKNRSRGLRPRTPHAFARGAHRQVKSVGFAQRAPSTPRRNVAFDQSHTIQDRSASPPRLARAGDGAIDRYKQQVILSCLYLLISPSFAWPAKAGHGEALLLLCELCALSAR